MNTVVFLESNLNSKVKSNNLEDGPMELFQSKLRLKVGEGKNEDGIRKK